MRRAVVVVWLLLALALGYTVWGMVHQEGVVERFETTVPPAT
jgi:hypothetical protein